MTIPRWKSQLAMATATKVLSQRRRERSYVKALEDEKTEKAGCECAVPIKKSCSKRGYPEGCYYAKH